MLLSSVCHRHSGGRESATETKKMTFLRNPLLKLVFLYGTLKTAEQNHYLLMQKGNGVARFVQKAVTREKYPLVVATQYNIPFMLNKVGTGKFITGELFEVDDQMLKVMDRLEDIGNLYDREIMTFNTINGLNETSTTKEAFVYVLKRYPKGLLDLPTIAEYKNDEVAAYIPPRERQNGTTKELLWKEYKT